MRLIIFRYFVYVCFILVFLFLTKNARPNGPGKSEPFAGSTLLSAAKSPVTHSPTKHYQHWFQAVKSVECAKYVWWLEQWGWRAEWEQYGGFLVKIKDFVFSGTLAVSEKQHSCAKEKILSWTSRFFGTNGNSCLFKSESFTKKWPD